MVKHPLTCRIGSSFDEPLFQKFNLPLVPLDLQKNQPISLEVLEKIYEQSYILEMNKWMPTYLFERDVTEPFSFQDQSRFKQYVLDSIWEPQEVDFLRKTPQTQILFDKLKFLGRYRVYDHIKKTIGLDWKNKTIIDFAAGKCIHSWLLGGLFRKVAAVEIQSKEIYIGLKIHEILGPRPNVDFIIADIESCYEEVINQYKPDFLMFQMGMGFWSLNQKYRQTGSHLIAPIGKELAEKIANKFGIPFWYN